MNTVILEFIEDMQISKNISEITAKSYKSDLSGYFLFCEENCIDVYSSKESDIKKYFEIIKNKNKNSTIIRKISSLKAFYDYLFRKRKIDTPIDFLPLKDGFNLQNNKCLSEEVELQKNYEDIISYFESLDKNKDNDTLLIISYLLIFSEIDFNNLFSINIENLKHYDYKKIVIKETNKILNIALDRNTSKILKEYIENYYFFCEILFQDFTKSYINRLFRNHNLNIRLIKKSKKLYKYNIREKIMQKYFEIGIGDD